LNQLQPEISGPAERVGFGRYEKVPLRFAEPFWRDAGLSRLMAFPSEPPGADCSARRR
jgi:hypothetical protein